jgi:hypothetical protein
MSLETLPDRDEVDGNALMKIYTVCLADDEIIEI